MKNIVTEIQLVEMAKRWLDEWDYSLAADAGEALYEAKVERDRGREQNPLFVVNLEDGSIAVYDRQYS